MGSLLGMLAAQLIVIEALRSDQFTTDEYNALGILEKTAIREHDLGVISLPYIGLGILVLIILFIIILTRFPIAREDQTMTFRESYALLLKIRDIMKESSHKDFMSGLRSCAGHSYFSM